MREGPVSQVQKRQAASSSQIDQLHQEILVLKGKLDETAHLNRILKEENKELETSIQFLSQQSDREKKEILQRFNTRDKVKEQQIKELMAKLERQGKSVRAIQAARVKEAERRAREAARVAEAAKKKVQDATALIDKKSPVPVIAATASKIKKSSTSPAAPRKIAPKTQAGGLTQSQSKNIPDLFSRAQGRYARGEFQTAFKDFEQFAENAPPKGRALEAEYMMGECLFRQKQYNRAIIQYQKIISDHPRHARAPSALLRQGMAFENLADHGTARIIYEKILTSYGTSPEASAARQQAAALQGAKDAT